MRKLIGMLLLSIFVMADWSAESESEKAAKAESDRLCKIYTMKTEKYKETMRDDEHARVTLANYERLQKKYCGDDVKDSNTSSMEDNKSN